VQESSPRNRTGVNMKKRKKNRKKNTEKGKNIKQDKDK
jgi:hypothetical protein